jgi:hypothetical protein
VPATNLTLNLEMGGEGRLEKAGDLSTALDPVRIGVGAFAPMAVNLTFGSGDHKAKEWAHDQFTLAAGANLDLDLAGGTLKNAFGDLLTFTAVKLLLVAVDAPDGTKKLRVGPQGVANGWPGPFGGTGATNYKELVNWEPVVNHPFAGYPVTAGSADVLRINNPTGVSVTGRYWLAGEV